MLYTQNTSAVFQSTITGSRKSIYVVELRAELAMFSWDCIFIWKMTQITIVIRLQCWVETFSVINQLGHWLQGNQLLMFVVITFKLSSENSNFRKHILSWEHRFQYLGALLMRSVMILKMWWCHILIYKEMCQHLRDVYNQRVNIL